MGLPTLTTIRRRDDSPAGPTPSQADRHRTTGLSRAPDKGNLPRHRWANWARWTLLVAIALMATFAVRSSWSDIRSELNELSLAAIVASSLAFAVSWALQYVAWRRMLQAIGGRWRGATDGLSTFSAAQLGKYLPGAVWPALIQADLGRRHGLGWRTMLAGYSLLLLISAATGTATGLLVLTGTPPNWVKLAVVVTALLGASITWAAVSPSRAHRWIDWILTRFTGTGLPQAMHGPDSVRAALVVGVSWLFNGLHAWFIAWQLGAAWSEFGLVVGGFAFATIAGLVVVPLPAGLGVREAVLVATLGAAIGRPGAITVALVSRFLQVLFDIVVAALAGGASLIGSRTSERRTRQ